MTLLHVLRRGGGFTPNSFGPTAWFDFSDLSTLFQDSAGTTPITTDGQTIGYVADKSGNAHHLIQATSGNRPTFKTGANGINSRGVGQGDGGNMQLQFTGISLAVPYTIIGVWQYVRTVNYETMLGIVGSNNNQIAHQGGPTYYIWSNGGSTGYISGTNQAAHTTSVIIGASGANATVNVEGGADQTCGTSGFATPITGIIMFRNGSGDACNGKLAEFAVYPRALTSTERTSLASYFVSRWATAL